RGVEARDHPRKPAGAGEEHARARIDRHRALGLEGDALVFAAFERSGARRAARAAAPGLPHGAGGVADAVERARARFQRRLPAQNLVKLLLVLLLVQQLAPGDAVDLRAQLRDAILVAGLHV